MEIETDFFYAALSMTSFNSPNVPITQNWANSTLRRPLGLNITPFNAKCRGEDIVGLLGVYPFPLFRGLGFSFPKLLKCPKYVKMGITGPSDDLQVPVTHHQMHIEFMYWATCCEFLSMIQGSLTQCPQIVQIPKIKYL